MSYAEWAGEAPSIVVLWDKKPTARRPHLCDRCNETIEVGQQYESAGWREDGVFKSEKRHLYAYSYPSGCPSIRVRELAEEEAAGYAPTQHKESPDV